MAEIKLKPCPFCNSESVYLMSQPGRYGRYAWVECDLCGARSKSFSTKFYVPEDKLPETLAFERAKNAWNRRASDG